MVNQERFVGGKTSASCTVEQEAAHAALLQNASFLVTLDRAPLEQRIHALSVCFAAYTDRGQA